MKVHAGLTLADAHDPPRARPAADRDAAEEEQRPVLIAREGQRAERADGDGGEEVRHEERHGRRREPVLLVRTSCSHLKEGVELGIGVGRVEACLHRLRRCGSARMRASS